MNFKKSLSHKVAILLVFSQCVTSLNILGVFLYPGKSHFLAFQNYLEELTKRGHNVTVISHYPRMDPPKNYHDISLVGSIKTFEDDIPFFISHYIVLLYTGYFFVSTGIENCRVMLENENVQKLIAEKPKFDLVIVEQFNTDCALGVAYKLQAPVIGVTSHVLMPWMYSRFGISYNPSYDSSHFMGGGTKPTLLQRVERALFHFYYTSLYHFIGQKMDENSLAQYYDDVPPLEYLAQEIKFLFLYHNFILTGSRNLPANVIEVGGHHVAKSKSLTGDIKKFVEESEHGVVYISFGSLLDTSTVPEEIVAAILNSVENLPQKFIWKWDASINVMHSNKLYISNWLPQVDILANPKTLAFLSHAGMGGTTEAIHYGVPVVAMPIFGDQPSNAAVIEESGLGVQLQPNDFTKDNLLTALKKVLDPEFRENVKKISAAWHDRPMSPMDTAIFWTEFAARYSNFTFTAAAAKVPLYQLWNLDIILVLILAIPTYLCCLFLVMKGILIYCRKSKTESLNQKIKKH